MKATGFLVTHPKVFGSAILVIGLAGLLLRARAFLHGRSLWLDEAALAESVLDLTFFEVIATPLLSGQSAPPGFMAGSFLIAHLFGINEFSIRLVPMLAGLATVFFAILISLKDLKSRIAGIFFLASMSLSPVLVYYSAEFKQYSVDVLAVIYFLYLTNRSLTGRLSILHGLFIFLISLSSLVAVPAALILFGAKIWQATNGESKLNLLSVTSHLRWPLGGFLVGATLHGLQLLRLGTSGAASAWRNVTVAFPPTDLQTFADWSWHLKALANVLSDPFIGQQVSVPRDFYPSLGIWAPMLALVLLGAVGRLRPVPRIFLFSVLGLPFLLSQAGLYPFGGRLTLFLVPVVLFLSALGLETLDQKWPRQRSLLALGIAIFLILPSATVSAGYFHKPNESRDTKWALGVIEHLSEQGDVLLIDDPNVRQVSFHSRTGDISTIETRRVSSELLMRDYYLSDVEGGLWILSTHRISEAGQMRDLLLESGFLQACSYNAKSTLVVLLELVDSEDQLRKCDITRR